MGKCYIHSTEAVWELIAREEWLGCRHDVAHVETYPGQHQCGHTVFYFSEFSKYQNLYLCFQIYMYYKKNTGGL